jgi:hypothetical protein
MEKIHLVPVPNIGIELKDSRHFVISANHPLGKAALLAINIGLDKLRNEHKIKQAFTEAGFFIDRKKIKVLNVQ